MSARAGWCSGDHQFQSLHHPNQASSVAGAMLALPQSNPQALRSASSGRDETPPGWGSAAIGSGPGREGAACQGRMAAEAEGAALMGVHDAAPHRVTERRRVPPVLLAAGML